MIELPPSPRHSHLRAHWVLVCLSALILAAPFMILMIGLPVSSLLLVGLTIFSLLGLRSRSLLQMVYQRSNFLIRHFARVARFATLSVLYVALSAVGIFGGRLDIRPRREELSNWKPRTTHDPRGYNSLYGKGHGHGARHWSRNLLAWSMETKNYWAVVLIPYLALLRLVQPEQAHRMESNIYTLF